MLTVTDVCSSDTSAHHSMFLSVFSPSQRPASPLHPPAWPTISVDTAPEVVEDSNWAVACHFLLPGPSHELLLLASGDPLCLEPHRKGLGDSISDSPQRSRRNLFLSWVNGMNIEVQKYHSYKCSGLCLESCSYCQLFP